jgi:hypothetical protein
MRHAFFTSSAAFTLFGVVFGVVSAQEVAPQSAPRADRSGWQSETFTIEIKVLEGRGLPQEAPTDPKPWTAAPATRGFDHRGRRAPPPPALAIRPNPVALPDDVDTKYKEYLQLAPSDAATRATERGRFADENADLWDDAQQKPGVTVLAAPKLAVVAGQSGVIQIQTQQIFTYLQPLGDGKFQAKHTDPTELGMKFVLGVQPVEGDKRSVEVSPLEIQLAVLDGREPVEGLDLDVGKPIIATRSLKTTAKMKLGDTRMIPIPSGPKTQAALLLRIRRVDSSLQEVAPPRAATIPGQVETSP